MKKSKTYFGAKIMGVLFVLAGFALLFVPTLKELPNSAIYVLWLGGTFLVLAPKRVIDVLANFFNSKIKKITKNKKP